MADKIVIRINNPRPAKADPSSPPPQVVVYHWHRIGFAVLIVAVAIGGLLAALRPERQQPAPSAQAQPAAANAPGSEDRDQRQLAAQDQAGAAASGVAAALQKPTAAVALATPAQRPTAEQPASAPLATALAPAAPPAGPVPAPVQTAASLAPEAPPRAHSEALIHSPAIRHLRLTSGLLAGAPVDEIGGTLPMNAKGLLKVFLYMETAGLKGRVLYHDWYWKDRRIAHARVPIRHNPQNAATSKYIDRIMTGPWLVKVVDEHNTVYGETRFEVR